MRADFGLRAVEVLLGLGGDVEKVLVFVLCGAGHFGGWGVVKCMEISGSAISGLVFV